MGSKVFTRFEVKDLKGLGVWSSGLGLGLGCRVLQFCGLEFGFTPTSHKLAYN